MKLNKVVLTLISIIIVASMIVSCAPQPTPIPVAPTTEPAAPAAPPATAAPAAPAAPAVVGKPPAITVCGYARCCRGKVSEPV